MSIIYYDDKCVEGLTLKDVETIRYTALRLVGKNLHPRYQMAIDDLFKAANALYNEMKLDEGRMGHCISNPKAGDESGEENNHHNESD